MILPVLGLVLAPALKLPVLCHDIKMAMPSYFASLDSPLIEERSEAVFHWASKTKAGEQLTVWLGIEPDFVDEFVFHWSFYCMNRLPEKKRLRQRGRVRYTRKIPRTGERIDAIDLDAMDGILANTTQATPRCAGHLLRLRLFLCSRL